MLVALGLATVALLAASATSSAHATRVIHFTGHGGRTLPAFTVKGPSTMFWTNSGSFFQITSMGGYCDDGAVASQLHRGTSYIPSGLYSQLRVAAIGNWTVTIRPGMESIPKPVAFRGSGGKALPPFRLPTAKTMYWTNSGTIFQMYPADKPTAGVVSTGYSHGKVRLPAGRYRFFVNATAADEPDGHWRIVVR